jgi:hypothetical protein
MKIYLRDWFWLCLVISILLTKMSVSYKLGWDHGREDGYTLGILVCEPYLSDPYNDNGNGVKMIPNHTYHYHNDELWNISPPNNQYPYIKITKEPIQWW